MCSSHILLCIRQCLPYNVWSWSSRKYSINVTWWEERIFSRPRSVKLVAACCFVHYDQIKLPFIGTSCSTLCLNAGRRVKDLGVQVRAGADLKPAMWPRVESASISCRTKLSETIISRKPFLYLYISLIGGSCSLSCWHLVKSQKREQEVTWWVKPQKFNVICPKKD